jgi:hypothetical protein
MSLPVELREWLAVETPLGPGYAIIFESGTDDNFWTVALETGAIVTFRQSKIRMVACYTYGRGVSDRQMRKIVRRNK